MTAVVVGLGALTLPFATLFFSHALSTAFVFSSFAVLVARPLTYRRLIGAGLLAGAAVVVEHSVWIAAAAVALYVVGRSRALRPVPPSQRVPRSASFLLLFNVWAFRDPLHTPYVDYWRENPVDAVALPRSSGFSLELFSSLGLLTLAPVLAAGIAGAVLLYRRGYRAEALVCLGVPSAFLVSRRQRRVRRTGAAAVPDADHAVCLALAGARASPLAAGTFTAAAITCFQAVLMTATGPLAAYDGQWLERVADRQFVATAAALVGVSGWYAIAPFFLAATVAVVCAAATLPPLRITMLDAALAVGVAGVWAVVARGSYNQWGRTPTSSYVLTVFVVLSIAVGRGCARHRHARKAP